MSPFPQRWRWRDPKGATGPAERTPQRAAEGAIRHALSARPGTALDPATEQKLWRSLKSKGWQVEEVEP